MNGCWLWKSVVLGAAVSGAVSSLGCAGDAVGARSGSNAERLMEMPMPERLRHHVEVLCADGPGGRTRAQPEAYARAASYIEETLRGAGFAEVEREYVPGYEGLAPNLIVELAGEGAADEMVVIGAHYDNIEETPGADDNASAVSVTLELARDHLRRHRAGDRDERTVRYAFFTNEEMPYFSTGDMGSQHHANSARERGEEITAMISVEMVGYFSDEPGSQRYPTGVELPGLPDRGNFIAIVTRLEDAGLERRIAASFGEASELPIVPAALPTFVRGVTHSDHASFWRADYPAAMLTDTSFLRNPHYHMPTDTPDTLDYERMAEVYEGMLAVVRDLARVREGPGAAGGGAARR